MLAYNLMNWFKETALGIKRRWQEPFVGKSYEFQPSWLKKGVVSN